MKDNGFGKFLSYFAIVLAIMIAIWGEIEEVWKKLLIGVGIFVGLCIISLLWSAILNANAHFVDLCHYLFSKRASTNYSILSRTITYEFIDKERAKYKDEVSLDIKKTVSHIKYRCRYGWDQSDDSKIVKSIVNPADDITLSDPDYILNWTFLTIEKSGALKKGSTWDTGFALEGLEVTKYSRKSYLCYKATNKTKSVTLIAKIPEEDREAFAKLGDKAPQARFFVMDAYEQDIEGLNEKVNYDAKIGGYKYTIEYPRLGRSYALDWH